MNHGGSGAFYQITRGGDTINGVYIQDAKTTYYLCFNWTADYQARIYIPFA